MPNDSQVLEAEVVTPVASPLAIIVRDSGLEQTKADYILSKFQDYFKIADEWEQRAKSIVVTDASQKDQMALARVGRLSLRDKRIAVESSRKELKEQSMREGKAIDGIANVLKALIIPIEEYLDKQEHFVELQAAAKAEQDRIEAEQKIEAERLAKEEADRQEQIRIRAENERLKIEAEKRERQIEAERIATEEKMRVEREKADSEKKAIETKARKEREAIEAKALAEKKQAEAAQKALEEKARVEREKQAKILADQKSKADVEKKAIEAKARKEREKNEAEKQRLIEEMKATIECPHCHKTFKMKAK